MRTTRRMTLAVLVGGLALAIAGASCKQVGPASSSGSGGKGSGGTTSSGGSSASGGSGSGGTSSSGGSNSGGSSASGGSSSGGSNASGGSNDTGGSNSGGSNSGGSSGNGGSSDTGGSNSGGSDSGGSSGNGGSSNTGGSTGSGGTTSEGGSSGTGGSTGAGGTTSEGGSSGTGGSSPGVLNCASPLKPSDGLVTDFSDYSTTTGKWGSTSGLYGAVYGYPGTKGSTMTGTVDATAKNLHLVGAINAGDYAGGGLSFYACATAASYTKVSFSLTGSFGGTASACDLELQIQTFDQRPTTQTPPGGCDASAGSCYGYPVKTKIGTPSSTTTTITLTLADFSKWSTANANQIVGLQWQITVPTASTTDDAALPSCAADFTIDDIKFQ